MANTASPRIYCLKDGEDVDSVSAELTSERGYRSLAIREIIQQQQRCRLVGFRKSNTNPPDWLEFIQPYLVDSGTFENVQRYDFVLLVILDKVDPSELSDAAGSTPSELTQGKPSYAITGGSGFHHIAPFVQSDFGISILEAVFDPEQNRLDAVAERKILGDVLASRRYYRTARPLSYEDDFGKHFQNIDIRLGENQVLEFFPAIGRYKGSQLGESISIGGSASLSINTKVDLPTLIGIIRDIEALPDDAPRLFNTALLPVDRRREKARHENLTQLVYNSIAERLCKGSQEEDFSEFDFCHTDFEQFFHSQQAELSLPGLHNKKGKLLPSIHVDEAYRLQLSKVATRCFDQIATIQEYRTASDKEEYVAQTLAQVGVRTFDSDKRLTTSGYLFEFLQTELKTEDGAFFLLDKTWYQIREQFDAKLTSQYEGRVQSNVREYDFISAWPKDINESAYNKSFESDNQALYLHLVKIGNVELCDVLYWDNDNHEVYIIHIKDGLGATVRDLTSQAFMSARILEEAVLAHDPDGGSGVLYDWYRAAVENDRISEKAVTAQEFVTGLTEYDRRYCLAIRPNSSGSTGSLYSGEFNSRIAKFSLVEFAAAMRDREWAFAFCEIPFGSSER